MEKHKPSKEYLERKELLLLERENVELKHKYKMLEMETEKKNSIEFHQRELEKIRIKSAEVRRTQQRKEFEKYSGA